jgi:diguanylate cyclase (GGDEF)-like protein
VRWSLTLRAKLLTGFAAPLLVAVLAVVGIDRTLEKSIATADRVAAGNQVVAQLNRLLKTVVDAETGERGFSMTSEERFLEPYQNARLSFRRQADALQALVAADPAQVEHVSRIEQLFERWQREVAVPGIAARREVPLRLGELVDQLHALLLSQASAESPPDLAALQARLAAIRVLALPAGTAAFWQQAGSLVDALHLACPPGEPRRSASCDASLAGLVQYVEQGVQATWAKQHRATDVADADEGKAIIDSLRQEADAFDRTARDRLESLVTESSADTRMRELQAVAGLTVAMICVLIVALVVALRAARAVAAVASAARGLAGGDLSRRALVSTSDEIGVLAQTFNTMAERLSSRDAEGALLAELSDMLQACFSLEEAHAVIARSGALLFPGTVGEALLVNASRNLLLPVGHWGAASVDGSGPWTPQDCWALRRGRPHQTDLHGAAGPCAHLGSAVPFFGLCVPLTAHGETIGLVTFWQDAPMKGARSPEDALRLGQFAGEQIGLALANLRLQEALRQQAIRDPLTGLFNRRYAEETLERELARSTRLRQPLALVMVDVDHFKRFNDTFGHDAGDLVLRSLGELLRSQLRTADIACRHGGEEFLLVLPDTSVEVALARAQQIREACSLLHLVHNGQPLGAVTLSLGVAVMPTHGDSAETLLSVADAALYKAKHAGRDRVQLAA